MHVLSYMEPIRWIYLYPSVDIHIKNLNPAPLNSSVNALCTTSLGLDSSKFIQQVRNEQRLIKIQS